MSESPATFNRPSNPTEIKGYLDEKVYPILDSSIEALLRHISSKSKSAGTTNGTSSHTEDENGPFSPLLWLSDHLRQYSR